ncbi:hypothetical protein AXF42_Ash006837 [Apostasia shenzhenica]|uniref:Retrotransposon gag domain-containing protein n=1 Tax=Apostasia shenzhenica TaxID=1088818 RepID=A0A2I0AJD1_9ASPA|nr:hypothetical protein AXF42_Ash006837 [Apostasia shenzhenica]
MRPSRRSQQSLLLVRRSRRLLLRSRRLRWLRVYHCQSQRPQHSSRRSRRTPLLVFRTRGGLPLLQELPLLRPLAPPILLVRIFLTRAPQYEPEAFFGPFNFDTAFCDAIRQASAPEDFRPPCLEVYKGTIDPRKHIQGFEAALRYRQRDEATKCHLLATTLKGATFTWFIKFPEGSLSSYDHMKQGIIASFI